MGFGPCIFYSFSCIIIEYALRDSAGIFQYFNWISEWVNLSAFFPGSRSAYHFDDADHHRMGS